MDRVVLMGGLTRDPEVRYSRGERSIAIVRYTLTVDRRDRRSQDGGSDRQTTDFINIVVFGRAGEFAEKCSHQGMKVLVSGRIQTGSYTNKDGQKVYTTDVIADDQELMDSKGVAGEDGGGSYQPASGPAPTSAVSDGFVNIPDGVEGEDLPFNQE